MAKAFKRAKDMDWEKEKTVPVSARIKKSTQSILKKEAGNKSLSALVGKILEEYALWIKSGGN